MRSDELAVAVIAALLDRTGIEPAEVEDVLLGASQHFGEQGFNVARFVAVTAGLPPQSAAATINRLCGSGLQALQQATHTIMADFEDVHIVGGLEHMHHLPIDVGWDVHPEFVERWSPEALSMGVSSDRLAAKRGISRRSQDEFAVRSHQLAAAAQARGELCKEIVPVVTVAKDKSVVIDADQCIRPDTCVERLAELQTAFTPDGTITAGNASPLSDGAAGLLMMSQEKAKSLGFQPLVRVVATAVAGVEPMDFGLGPVVATRKVLRRAGMTLEDMDLVELNEAFAAQVLACLQELDIDEEKLNVRGGALAIGHPLGASGARIATTLINAMVDRDATLGLATMCIGHGQGVATIFERIG